jgi:hypothetical protein
MRRLYQIWSDSPGLTSEQRGSLLAEVSDPESSFNQFPFSEEECREPIVDIHGEEYTPIVFYKSEVLADTEIFNKIFPYFKLQGTNGRLQTSGSGWVKAEASHNAPNCKTTEHEVREFFQEKGLQGQDIVTYAILADAMGRIHKGADHLDEGTASRLLGAAQGELVIDTRVPQFDAFGGRAGLTWNPEHKSVGFGARSEQRKA